MIESTIMNFMKRKDKKLPSLNFFSLSDYKRLFFTLFKIDLQ